MKNVSECSFHSVLYQGAVGGAEAGHHATQEVQQGACDLRVCPQEVVNTRDESGSGM